MHFIFTKPVGDCWNDSWWVLCFLLYLSSVFLQMAGLWWAPGKQHRRSIQSAQFQAAPPRLVSLAQQKSVVAGHYGVTVKLNCGLLDRKCHHFTILSYPTFLWNVVIISVWIWPWPLTSHQNLISSSNRMFESNLKNFPQGIPEIPRSQEREEQTDNPKT